MKVKLFKQEEVEFNLSEDKCEKISHKTFRMLTGSRRISQNGRIQDQGRIPG